MKHNTLILSVIIAPLICFLSSCASGPPLEPAQIQKMAQEGIVVVEGAEDKPTFAHIGTTVFNNSTETLSEPGTSFADYMVTRLKAKGHKASKSESTDHPRLLLLQATYPYQRPEMTGVGFYRRSFLGVSAPITAYCNFRGILLDKETNLTKAQPVNFGNKGYQHGATPVKKSVKSWSELTASEKNQMKSTLQTHMTAQADFILSQLGL